MFNPGDLFTAYSLTESEVFLIRSSLHVGY